MSGSLDVLVLSMGGPVVTSTGRTMGDVVAERVLSLAASLELASVGVEFGWHVCKDELKTCVTHTRVRREKKKQIQRGRGRRFRACPVERRQSVDELNPEIHNGTRAKGGYFGRLHELATNTSSSTRLAQAGSRNGETIDGNFTRESYLVGSNRFAAVRQAFLVLIRLGFIRLVSWKRCR